MHHLAYQNISQLLCDGYMHVFVGEDRLYFEVPLQAPLSYVFFLFLWKL